MGDIGIQVTVETPDGTEVLRLARPDLLDMDAINEKYDEWQELGEQAKKGVTPKGMFKDINDFLAKYAPALCYSHRIAVVDGTRTGETPGGLPNADFYIVTSRDVELTPELIRRRLDMVALMAMFTGIMESVGSVGEAVKEGAAETDSFLGQDKSPSIFGRGGAPGGTDEPPPE